MGKDRERLVGPPWPRPAAPAGTEPRRAAATRLVQAGSALAVRALYRCEILAPPDFALRPGTLVVSNHLRDADVPILATALYRRAGAGSRLPPLSFAAREDLLRPRALAMLTAEWPPPLPALFGRVPIGWLFTAARAEPMCRIRELTLRGLAPALASAGLGDADCGAVLNARGLRELGAHFAARPLRCAAADRRAPLDAAWGLRRLRRHARALLAPALRARIAMQLRDFAHVLDAGHCLYLAPEGATSPDGRFGRVREGAWRIHRLAARAHPVLPLALSYDALAPGRLRAVVRIGAPVYGLDASSARSFAAGLRHAITRLVVVNPSHLLARYLAEGPSRFTTAEVARWMDAAGRAAAAAGFALDPLLGRVAGDRLAERRLRWLAAEGIIVREPRHWRNVWPRDSRAGWRGPANAVRYLANALVDLSPELERALRP